MFPELKRRRWPDPFGSMPAKERLICCCCFRRKKKEGLPQPEKKAMKWGSMLLKQQSADTDGLSLLGSSIEEEYRIGFVARIEKQSREEDRRC